MVRDADAEVFGALHPEPEFVGDAEERIAHETGLAPEEVHAVLSRLFTAGRVRFVRVAGITCYERMMPVPL